MACQPANNKIALLIEGGPNGHAGVSGPTGTQGNTGE